MTHRPRATRACARKALRACARKALDALLSGVWLHGIWSIFADHFAAASYSERARADAPCVPPLSPPAASPYHASLLLRRVHPTLPSLCPSPALRCARHRAPAAAPRLARRGRPPLAGTRRQGRRLPQGEQAASACHPWPPPSPHLLPRHIYMRTWRRVPLLLLCIPRTHTHTPRWLARFACMHAPTRALPRLRTR